MEVDSMYYIIISIRRTIKGSSGCSYKCLIWISSEDAQLWYLEWFKYQEYEIHFFHRIIWQYKITEISKLDSFLLNFQKKNSKFSFYSIQVWYNNKLRLLWEGLEKERKIPNT